jgi:hypothetical protein
LSDKFFRKATEGPVYAGGNTKVVVSSAEGQLRQQGAAITASAAELNIMDGVTADKDEINRLDGATAGTAVASKAVVLDADKHLAGAVIDAPTTAYAESGAIALTAGFAAMDTTAGPLAMTLANPGKAGIMLAIQLTTKPGANSAVVTTATAAGFDGTNNTATFDAAGETLVLYSISATRWTILSNVGSVGLSAV